MNDIAYYRIKNPKVSSGIMTGDSEIISRVEKTAQYKGFDITVNVKSLIGLLDFGKYHYIPKMIDVIDFKEEKETSNIVPYPDSISGQEAIWNKAIRYYSYSLEGVFFKEPGDLIYLGYDLQIPTDEGFERVPGERKLEYNFQFDIYGRDAFRFYTKKVGEVESYFTQSYQVLE
ncbi:MULTISPECIES: hypothetical protein [Gracilibacillus]|uniref:hypothetical protein n=1 Tax=Gracilibacillus TaxID=74385 RepID=UPI0008271068|nr:MULTISPECIES: hypothetical protein [Gracilibacillus]